MKDQLKSYHWKFDRLNLFISYLWKNDSCRVLYPFSEKKLKHLIYEEWIEKYADDEFNTSADIRGVPTHIVRTPSRELICHPVPDKAYTIVYEYYSLGYDLEGALDVPALPEQYRFAIVDGAMYYAYQFRGDTQAANIALQKFEMQIKNLRSIYINRTPYIRDRRVHF